MDFDGFISYSHAADGRLAPAVQRGLHRLAKPWHRRRALWIFRDQTGLAVTPGLWSSIQTALDGSQYFVLLASPEAARSPWVNKEIEHWVATKSPEQILPVLTDGQWQWDPAAGDFTEDSTAVPAALRGKFAEEPLYLDLRWARDDLHLSLQHPRFRDAIAQLAAPMHGVSKDELEGEDVRQHRRARRLWSAATAMLVALTLVASLTGVLALRNADRANDAAVEARQQQQVAAEQRGSAERATQESRRQQENAQEQQRRAQAAAAETRRQEKLTRAQQTAAERAAAEATRQQSNARRQQQLARRAGALARELEAVTKEQGELAAQAVQETDRQRRIAEQQQRFAREAAAEARQQKQIAQQQQQFAREAAAEAEHQAHLAREQQRIARDQQRQAEQAAADARRQKDQAEQQRRIAIGRRLINQAKATVDNDPETALMLGLAASKVQPGAEARTELTGLVTSTHYAGTFAGATAIAYGSGGLLAARDHDGKVSLWDATDQANPVRLAPLGDQAVGRALTFSPDGRTLAVPGPDQALVLWDVTNRLSPSQVGTVVNGQRGIYSVAFSPDGNTLAMSHGDDYGADGSLWDVTDRARPERLSTLTDYNAFPAYDLTFSPDGRTLVTSRHEAAIWDVTDRSKPAMIGTLSDDRISTVAFSPQWPLLATGGEHGAVKLWHMRAPERPLPVGTLPGHTAWVQEMAFSSDGRTLTSGDGHGVVNMWHLADGLSDGVHIGSLTSRRGIQSMTLSPDGETLVITDVSATATVWNVATHGSPRPIADLTEHRGELLTVAFTEDGRSMATADSGGKATLWDLTDPARPTRRATLFDTEGLNAVAFSRDRRIVATADHVGQVTLSDVSRPDRPVTLSSFDGEVPSFGTMTFSPDGRFLAIDAGDWEVVLWDLANQSQPTRFATLPDVQRPVAFSPDSSTVAAAHTTAHSATLWDLAGRPTPVKLADLTGHRDRVESMAFSPDGKTMATGSADHTAMRWDVTNRARPRWRTVLRHTDTVTSVAFSPDGHTLATASRNQTARLWDITDPIDAVRVATMRLDTSTRSQVLYNRSMVFSPDGRTLAAAGDNGYTGANLMLWDYTELNRLRADPAGGACAVAGRGLTDDEWARYIPELPHERTCPAG